MPELYSNDPSTTLNGTINNSATALTVISPTGFPGAGNFRIRIDSELMLVTAVSGSVFTVTRAIEGTSAASHTSGAAVNHFLTAGALNAVRADMIQCGLAASRPATGRQGDLYIASDTGALSFSTGASWIVFTGLTP